jgi:hypothetical protein
MNFQRVSSLSSSAGVFTQSFSPKQQALLLKTFWTVAIALFCFIMTQKADIIDIFCAIAISIFALIPSYLWCKNTAKGLPMYPLLALSFIFTHALPLVSKHPMIALYPPGAHFQAATTVVMFLVVGLFTWLPWVKKIPTPPIRYYALAPQTGEILFLIILFLGIIYYSFLNTNLIFTLLGSGGLALLRGFILGLNILGIFTLSFRLGQKQIYGYKAKIFIGLTIIYLLCNMANLYLVGAITTASLGIIGFTVGSRQFPWKALVITILIVSLLNLGKAEMRARYWFQGSESVRLMPWEYPSFYMEWVNTSLKNLGGDRPNTIQPEQDKGHSLAERASLMHMLLFIQYASPRYIPYLSGETYKIIPQLLVPRFLNPNKLRGGEGNHILSITYGLQSYEATKVTSIGWGLLQEAYANFGFIGCIGLALFLGSLYGWVTRWCMTTDLFSFRSLLAILITNTSFQTEWTAGSFISVLFQGSVCLSIVAWFLMKSQVHESYLNTSGINQNLQSSKILRSSK